MTSASIMAIVIEGATEEMSGVMRGMAISAQGGIARVRELAADAITVRLVAAELESLFRGDVARTLLNPRIRLAAHLLHDASIPCDAFEMRV